MNCSCRVQRHHTATLFFNNETNRPWRQHPHTALPHDTCGHTGDARRQLKNTNGSTNGSRCYQQDDGWEAGPGKSSLAWQRGARRRPSRPLPIGAAAKAENTRCKERLRRTQSTRPYRPEVLPYEAVCATMPCSCQAGRQPRRTKRLLHGMLAHACVRARPLSAR